jgi:septal ring factor EnvC (AmiA/AmiB activator)
MIWCFLLLNLARAQDPAPSPPAPSEVSDRIQQTRAGISEDERQQREALSHLFVINKNVKQIAQKQHDLNQRMLAQEASVRALALDVQALEVRTDQQKSMLNQRLRQLYQEHGRDDFHWLFSAQSPVELERNHRFLRRMIDSDHRQLKAYLGVLGELHKKRDALKGMVAHLAGLQRQVQAQEQELNQQLTAKARFLDELKKSKDLKLSELKGLRSKQGVGSTNYAFFERKGLLRQPAALPLAREYGTYVDPQFRFRLTHKGLFYSSPRPAEVRAVFPGRVIFAKKMPGYGKTVIIDHGDNYYSVYASATQLRVVEGANVQEGDLVAFSGASMPLFGPGLYFEIRHFTDAIDPRPWIKDSGARAAEGDKP